MAVRPQIDHPWNLSIAQAREVQSRLAKSVISEDLPEQSRNIIAGIDVGFENKNTVTRAAIVLLSYPQLEMIESVVATTPTCFPYVPGYLSFREIPAIIKAFEQLKNKPDVLMCDGQGLAHPRRFGIACHLGVLIGIPSLGVAKKKLVGEYEMPKNSKGARTPLIDKGEVIGTVLRTRINVKPVIVSVGHMLSLATAVAITDTCAVKYKLPEPTRLADRLASNRC